MKNEIRELMERVKSGDKNAGEAMVNNGINCHRNGDINGTIEWWEAAASADVGDAAWNLTYIIYGNPTVGKADSKRFMYWLSELANEWKNPPSMVILGAILCGSAENHYITNIYPELASSYNPREGFELIEEAVKRAEDTSRNPQNPLGYTHYSDIKNAYHADTRKRAEGGSASLYFKDFSHLAALAKKLIYTDRAFEALKAGRGVQGIPQENLAQIIMVFPAALDASRKELLSILKSLLHRDSYENEMMREINALRNTGEINGWAPAGKDELADVLEKYLRVALDEVM